MAKFFTESRLLQQDVKLLIEGVSNQLVIATIIHPVRICMITCTYVCNLPHVYEQVNVWELNTNLLAHLSLSTKCVFHIFICLLGGFFSYGHWQ